MESSAYILRGIGLRWALLSVRTGCPWRYVLPRISVTCHVLAERWQALRMHELIEIASMLYLGWYVSNKPTQQRSVTE